MIVALSRESNAQGIPYHSGQYILFYFIMSELLAACGSMVTPGSSLMKKPVDVFHFIQTAQVAKAQLVNGLLPRATAPFFSVKLFELAA
jgi:hypothetical protein